MNYISKQLTDKNDNLVMPITTTNEILTSDGKNIEEEIQQIKEYIFSLENRTETKY